MGVEGESRAALVTGASRGIGKEIALELARNGWRVAVNHYGDPIPLADDTLAEIRGTDHSRQSAIRGMRRVSYSPMKRSSALPDTLAKTLCLFRRHKAIECGLRVWVGEVA